MKWARTNDEGDDEEYCNAREQTGGHEPRPGQRYHARTKVGDNNEDKKSQNAKLIEITVKAALKRMTSVCELIISEKEYNG